jgi:hypothetical protein
MKRLLSSIIWFGSGAVLGQVAHTLLFQLWTQLGFLTPPNRSWYVLWINAPEWLVAAAIGASAGIFIKRHLVTRLLLFGLGFAFAPPAIYWYLNSNTPTLRGVAGDAVCIPILIWCALIIRNPTRPANQHLQPTPR